MKQSPKNQKWGDHLARSTCPVSEIPRGYPAWKILPQRRYDNVGDNYYTLIRLRQLINKKCQENSPKHHFFHDNTPFHTAPSWLSSSLRILSIKLSPCSILSCSYAMRIFFVPMASQGGWRISFSFWWRRENFYSRIMSKDGYKFFFILGFQVCPEI